jgi:hypothetical protein
LQPFQGEIFETSIGKHRRFAILWCVTRFATENAQLNSARKGKTMLRTIVIILLVLFLLGALPAWPYSAHWGYYPSGGAGLLLLIVIILVVIKVL